MGFSHSTWRPARKASMVCAACLNTGVAIYTAVASLSASAEARSLHDFTPYGSAFAGSRVTIPASRLRDSAKIAGSTRLRVISPTPTTSPDSISQWERNARFQKCGQVFRETLPSGRGIGILVATYEDIPNH